MHRLPSAALDHFERRHGVASHAELTGLGVSPHLIKRLRASGALRDVLKGAYHLRGQPLTFLGRCVAVCVAHPGHVIAGPSAGRIWEFRRLSAQLKVHTVSPPASQPTLAPWVQPYRTAAIDLQADVVHRDDGIVLTNRARTVLDLARWLGDLDLLSVMEQAASDGSLTAEDFTAVAIDWMSSQRPWLTRFLRLADSRLDGGAADSHPEVALGEALQAAGVHGLERQHRIELPGYGRARFDLAVPRLKWAIEIDMFPTHRETAGQQSDAQRDAAALSMGWVTTRLGPDRFGAAFDPSVGELLALYREMSAAARTTGR